MRKYMNTTVSLLTPVKVKLKNVCQDIQTLFKMHNSLGQMKLAMCKRDEEPNFRKMTNHFLLCVFYSLCFTVVFIHLKK